MSKSSPFLAHFVFVVAVGVAALACSHTISLQSLSSLGGQTASSGESTLVHKPDFLTSAELAHVNMLVTGKGEEAWWGCGGIGGGKECAYLEFENDLQVQIILMKLATFSGANTSNLVRLPLVRYLPGASATPAHIDHLSDGRVPGTAIMIYLSDAPNRVLFPKLDIKVKPARGALLMWRNLDSEGRELSEAIHSVEALPSNWVHPRIALQLPVVDHDRKLMEPLHYGAAADRPVVQPSTDPSSQPSTDPSSPPTPSPTPSPTPPPTPSPTPPPTPSPTPLVGSGSATGDLHIHHAGGGATDLRGYDGAIMVMHQAAHVSLSARFTCANFSLAAEDPRATTVLEVQGSFITAAYAVLKTKILGVTGTLQVEYKAERHRQARVTHIDEASGTTTLGTWVGVESGDVNVGHATVGLRPVEPRSIQLVVANGAWEYTVTPGTHRIVPSGARGIHFDIGVTAITDPLTAPVAAHGLIGQGFDGLHIEGRKDDYVADADGVFRTSAQGQGAIEGVVADYVVDSHNPFSPEFKFGRFAAALAAPRDISNLNAPVGTPKGTA